MAGLYNHFLCIVHITLYNTAHIRAGLAAPAGIFKL